jgi:hypothetical protein
MDPDRRSIRLGEIESDLWEAGHDTPPLSASHLLLRLICGIPADLGWRWEERSMAVERRLTIAFTGAAIITAAMAVWTVLAAPRVELPEPGSARFVLLAAPLVPMPPPPPPPPPPGAGRRWSGMNRPPPPPPPPPPRDVTPFH